MRTESIERFLDALATRAGPAGSPGTPDSPGSPDSPGPGAGAALHAAQGAALVARVARVTERGRVDRADRAERADVVAAARDAADGYQEDALRLAADDAEAVARLALARGLPRDTPGEADARSAAVAAALLGAGRVSARVVGLSGRILGLAERLRPIADRRAAVDVAAAAEALRAAVGTARLHVELRLSGLGEPDAREELLTAVEAADDLLLRAAKTTATVREHILR